MPQLDVFRSTLAAKLGRVLTPEDAAEIEAAFFFVPDESHEPKQFGKVERSGYSIQAEKFADIVGEIHPLHQQHWLETEKHRHGLVLNPNYDTLLACERAGRLLQFTMRTDAGELVGNLRMYILPCAHTKTQYGMEDTLFIKPEHRGGFNVMALMRFAEVSLRSLGIREIRVNSKLVNKADVLMRRMGYDPVALEFVKFFEE